MLRWPESRPSEQVLHRFPLDLDQPNTMAMAVDTPSRSPGGAAVMEKAPERVRKPSPRYKVLLHNTR